MVMDDEHRKALEEGYESRIEDLEKIIEDFKEGSANPLNYADLKDENRRLHDLLTMHEDAQKSQLADNALLQKRLAALEAVICKAAEYIHMAEQTLQGDL